MHHFEYVPSLYIQPPPALTISAAMADLEHHSLASHSSVANLVHQFSSLDMSPTAEEAYSQALIASSQPHHSSVIRGESAPPTVNSISSHSEFLHLLARFHQAVRPLSASTQPGAFITDPDSQEFHTQRKFKKSRSDTRPTRRSSSPGSSSTKKVTIPRVFTDMNSLLKKAEEMIDFMRADVEETMRRSRKLDRESRERSRSHSDDDSNMAVDGGKDADEGEPMLRKVPLSKRFSSRSHASWYAHNATSPEVQDHSMSALMPMPRPIITPRRIRHRLTNSDSIPALPQGFNSISSTLDQDIPEGFPTHLALPDRPPHIPWTAHDSILCSPIQTPIPLPQIETASSPIPMDDIDSCSSRLVSLRLSTDNEAKQEDWEDLEVPGLSTSPTESVVSSASILTTPSEPVRARPTRTRSNAISGGSLSNINPIRMYAGYVHPPKPKSFSFSGGISGIMGTTSPSGIAL